MVQLMPLHPRSPSSLASFKSRLVLPFWYRLIQVVLEKRPLNGCSSCCCSGGSDSSSSTPAPGYYNDDDVPDFLVHWQYGPGFPVYYHAVVRASLVALYAIRYDNETIGYEMLF